MPPNMGIPYWDAQRYIIFFVFLQRRVPRIIYWPVDLLSCSAWTAHSPELNSVLLARRSWCLAGIQSLLFPRPTDKSCSGPIMLIAPLLWKSKAIFFHGPHFSFCGFSLVLFLFWILSPKSCCRKLINLTGLSCCLLGVLHPLQTHFKLLLKSLEWRGLESRASHLPLVFGYLSRSRRSTGTAEFRV